MWHTEHRMRTNARPEAIWALWSDHDTWTEWDHGIESVKAEGPFAAGTKGVLRPKGGPAVRFLLLEAEAPRRFVDRSFLPLARMDFIHEAFVEDGMTTVIHRVEMRGLLTPLFRRVIGAGIRRDLPQTMGRLIALAEKRS